MPRHSTAAACIALFVALGGSTIAATNTGGTRNTTLRLGVRITSGHNANEGPSELSPGDILTFHGDLLTPSGTKTGSIEGFCIVTSDEQSRTCSETYQLHGGVLYIQGTTGLGQKATITGGTGRYAGVEGTDEGGNRTHRASCPTPSA